ncbi:hypothetical protein AGMMS49982_04610 [Bacteroidia bacterium]|nr:hypothetical protein AGMMS49982_04610 [Bacteroidia bacterium]
MSHIFRLHEQAVGNCEDWQGDETTKYTSSVIEEMQDASPKREITSIPSPFARIDLVKTAFKKVNKLGIDGDTIHHKMVSECLDVGQIFFNFDKFIGQIEIMAWDKENDLEKLLNSPDAEHQQLGRTYDLYLQQDGEAYNFDRMQQMYFLNFVKGPSKINIIGATSPATLFFTSANDLSYVSKAIRFGNDSPFDGEYIPLYKRDLEYQKYWHLLRKTPNFSKLFKEVDEYLETNFNKLSEGDKEKMREQIKAEDLTQYNDVTLENAGHVVQVIDGLVLKQQKQNPSDVGAVSGFVIKSDATISGHSPLVLPVETYVLPTVYVKEKWDKNTVVLYYDTRKPEDRTLPGDGALYPYLTIGDFLEDTIVRMPYELNKNSFFDGNLDKNDGKDSDGDPYKFSFLLPLRDLFFNFFSADDLRTKVMHDNKKMFELKNHATGVRAILRIPIEAGYIEYSRTYFEAVLPNRETNDGALIDKKFGLGILPLIKFSEAVNKHYRIALSDKGQKDVKLFCYNGKKEISTTAHVVRDAKDLADNINSSEAYVINDNFDRINVSVGECKGVIVPKFASVGGKNQFTFAVDFGTTNTHIEYTTDNNPITFNICANEKQLHLLHENYDASDKDIAGIFKHDFIPNTIDDSDEYSFPMRTVFQEHQNIDYNKRPIALADGNIPFLYEKKGTPDYNEAKTDLKWSGVPDKIIKLYLENIFILLRNKVLLNSGDLKATKIIWFYPASMDEGRCIQLNKVWKDLYLDYFGADAEKNVISMSESIAPYHYYSKKQGARGNVVTIDVGGGTTDVYVVENREPKMLLSFRFASNAIFGDGHNNWDSDYNGFVNLYMDKFMQILSSNKQEELETVLKNIGARKKSSDIIVFLFSLTSNKKVKGNDALDFLAALSNDERLRYVFIVFYGAIIYYIAKAMKVKGLSKPLTLAFSGNGSKTLRALSDSNAMIGKFAKLIFDGVFNDGERESAPLDVKFEENPKKATCKGGILEPKAQNFDKIDAIKCTLLGNTFDEIATKQMRYADITPDVEKQICQEVSNYIDFLFKLHDDNNNFFTNKLAADPGILQIVKKICQDKTELSQSLLDGLDQKYKDWLGSSEDSVNLTELKESNKVEETLFFYPLIGVLHALALKISEL